MKGTGVGAWLVYVAVRLVFSIMRIFPLERNLRTARWLTRIWVRYMPRHLHRAVDHLTAAYGATLDQAHVQLLARQCLESAAMFAVETGCLPPLINSFTWPRFFNLVQFDAAIELAISGKGMILVTGHYGAFELIGHVLACLGFDVVAIMRPMDNEYLNRFLVETRRSHGLTLLYKKGATEQAEAVLARGAMLGFIGDQDAGRKGCFVDFFGRPASTYKSIALLAMATQTPIVVGYVRRRGYAAKYDVGIERIILPSEWETQNDPLRWITQTYTAAMESFIRSAPEQYWWMHRRWKSQPRAGTKGAR